MLSSSWGQGNFRRPKASRPMPRTSKCILEDVLEAKDVLEDSTSAVQVFSSHCNQPSASCWIMKPSQLPFFSDIKIWTLQYKQRARQLFNLHQVDARFGTPRNPDLKFWKVNQFLPISIPGFLWWYSAILLSHKYQCSADGSWDLVFLVSIPYCMSGDLTFLTSFL